MDYDTNSEYVQVHSWTTI